MKKQLLSIALAAISWSPLGEAKSFDGAFVGANMGYKWEHLKGTARESTLATSMDLSGFNASVLVGYGATFQSVYVGGDIRGGYGWGRVAKNVDVGGNTLIFNTQQRWTGGVGASIGHEYTEGLLMFVRLGLDMNMYQIKTTLLGQYFTKGLTSMALVPGVGVKWKLDHNMYVTGMYEHSRQLSANGFSGFKAHALNSHGVKVGIGYQF